MTIKHHPFYLTASFGQSVQKSSTESWQPEKQGRKMLKHSKSSDWYVWPDMCELFVITSH